MITSDLADVSVVKYGWKSHEQSMQARAYLPDKWIRYTYLQQCCLFQEGVDIIGKAVGERPERISNLLW